MIWLLRWLILGHVHNWEEVSREPCVGRAFDGTSAVTSVIVHCRCKNCGEPRAFKCQ